LPGSTTSASTAATADAGPQRGGGHRARDPLEIADGPSVLDDQAGREGDRPGAGHRQAVDRPVDRELPDVTAGEEEWADDVTIGGECELSLACGEQGTFAARLQQRVAQLSSEDPLDAG
jgi:hypothetical protein